MAHKLRMDAVQSNTSNDIHILQNIQPSCHEPVKWNFNAISNFAARGRNFSSRESFITTGERVLIEEADC